jgi:hypothetical protein
MRGVPPKLSLFVSIVAALAVIGCGGDSDDTNDVRLEGVSVHADSFCGTNPLQLDGKSSDTFHFDSGITLINTQTNQMYPVGNLNVGPDGKSLTGTAPANLPAGQYNILIVLSSNNSPTNVGTVTYNTSC